MTGNTVIFTTFKLFKSQESDMGSLTYSTGIVTFLFRPYRAVLAPRHQIHEQCPGLVTGQRGHGQDSWTQTVLS